MGVGVRVGFRVRIRVGGRVMARAGVIVRARVNEPAPLSCHTRR